MMLEVAEVAAVVRCSSRVMPALVAGIHALLALHPKKKDVDGRDKPGHDEIENPNTAIRFFATNHKKRGNIKCRRTSHVLKFCFTCRCF